MIGTFMLKLQHIYAEHTLQPPFAQNYEIRLFFLEKQSLCREYGAHDAVTEVIRLFFFDLQTI